MMSWSVFNNIEAFREMGCAPSILEEAMQWNIKWKAFLACPMGPYLRDLREGRYEAELAKLE